MPPEPAEHSRLRRVVPGNLCSSRQACSQLRSRQMPTSSSARGHPRPGAAARPENCDEASCRACEAATTGWSSKLQSNAGTILKNETMLDFQNEHVLQSRGQNLHSRANIVIRSIIV